MVTPKGSITVLVVGDARRAEAIDAAIGALGPERADGTRFEPNDRATETIVAQARAAIPSQGVVVIVEREGDVDLHLAQGADEILVEPIDAASLGRALRHAALRAAVRHNHAIETRTLERVLSGLAGAAESPLASLALDLDGLRAGSFESLEDFDAALDDCAQAVDQVGELLRDASVLAQLDDGDVGAPLCIERLLRQVLHALGDGAGLLAHVEVHADDELPAIFAPPRRLARAVANVILQALDAIPTEPAPALRRLRIAVRAMPESVVLTFEVHACTASAPAGPPAELTPEGVLAVTRAELRSFDAELFTQRGGDGAVRMLLFVPRLPPAAPRSSLRPPPRSAPPRRRKRVLVVDRDTRVLRAISRALADHYDVLVALGCEEALAVAREAEVDAVVLDPQLADLRISALMDEIVRIAPTLDRRFVLLGPPPDGSSAQGAPVLKKPLRRQSLLVAIESRLPARHLSPSRVLN